MSKRKSVIELECPGEGMAGGGQTRELLVSPGHLCGRCHGAGGFIGWGSPYGDDVWTVCPLCGGIGKVDAVVTVEWRPSEKKDNQ